MFEDMTSPLMGIDDLAVSLIKVVGLQDKEKYGAYISQLPKFNVVYRGVT